MPHELLVAWFFILGLIIGSFLNVVIYRMHTGKSLNGRSRCLSCGRTLLWWHLVPVVSYILLRSRCGLCGARVSLRYSLVEFGTGLLFALVASSVMGIMPMFLYLVLMSVLVLVVIYDVLHTIIPDEFVVIATVCAIALVGFDFYMLPDAHTVLLRILSAAVGFLFFGSLWRMSDGRWVGLGDAKLAVPLGLILSWPAVVSAIVLSFWIGAAMSVTILGLQKVLRHMAGRGQIRLGFLSHSLTMKSEIPFAPFLVIGFLMAHFFSVDVFEVTAALFF